MTPLKGTRTKRGALTKAQRLALTETLAADILKVYKGLGGAKWLLEWARDNPTEFMKQGLARLLPPMPKDPAEDSPLVNLNFSGDPTEAARRIAFALAKGADAMGQEPVADRVPYSRLAREDLDPRESCHIDAPDPERETFFREVSLTTEEKLNAKDLDAHCNRRAFAPQRPSWMPPTQEERVPVRLRNKRDLL